MDIITTKITTIPKILQTLCLNKLCGSLKNPSTSYLKCCLPISLLFTVSLRVIGECGFWVCLTRVLGLYLVTRCILGIK